MALPQTTCALWHGRGSCQGGIGLIGSCPCHGAAGVSLRDDFPSDHWHHRGLFWAWPVVEVGGKQYDPVKTPTVNAGGQQARLQAESFWEAVHAPVTLQGSAESGKSYGGFSARFAPGESTILRADGEVLAKDEDRNPRKWAELERVYGGKRAVLRITPDEKNSGAPHQWCLRLSL